MRSAIERTVPGRFLTDPDAVLNFCNDGAADRTMRADILSDFGRGADDFRPGLCLAHRSERHQTQRGTCTCGQAGAAQKRAADENSRGKAGGDTLQTCPPYRTLSS